MTSKDAILEQPRAVSRRSIRWGRAVLAPVAAALALGAMAGPAVAATPPNGSANYKFLRLDDQADLTFNQLLGISNNGRIAGYFGSGAAGHPNKGYVIKPPYAQADYTNENFPGSSQTQVTGLNNIGYTVGFWVDRKGNNFGFYNHNGTFHTVDYPATNNQTPQVDQLLGVNDQNVAVGFYTNTAGNNVGYTYNIATDKYALVKVPGASSLTAAAINNIGDIAGFETTSGRAQVAFLEGAGGHVTTLSFPGASATQAFGVNDGEEVVGAYTIGTGTSATTHGFTWVPGFGFQTVDDPFGIGSTFINGVNDHGQLVGFYTDSAGNTDGMLANPRL